MNKIALSVLTKGYNNRDLYDKNLIKRNLLLEKLITTQNIKNYDFLILHEGNISISDQEYISNATPNIVIQFWDVKTKSPKTAFNDNNNKTNVNLCPPNFLSNNFSLGYKHMCHFWSIDFLDYFKDYDYLIRIDEDCFIEEFDFNVINKMDSEDIKFISPYFQEQDVSQVIQGLNQLRDEFIKNNNITDYTNFDEIKCPYTNFMIVNIPKMRNNILLNKFLQKIHECDCIYSNRWGDLPIWGVILDMIFSKNDYKQLTNIKYFHGSHNKKIN